MIKSEENTVSEDVGFESHNLSTSISFIPDADYDVPSSFNGPITLAITYHWYPSLSLSDCQTASTTHYQTYHSNASVSRRVNGTQ